MIFDKDIMKCLLMYRGKFSRIRISQDSFFLGKEKKKERKAKKKQYFNLIKNVSFLWNLFHITLLLKKEHKKPVLILVKEFTILIWLRDDCKCKNLIRSSKTAVNQQVVWFFDKDNTINIFHTSWIMNGIFHRRLLHDAKLIEAHSIRIRYNSVQVSVSPND